MTNGQSVPSWVFNYMSYLMCRSIDADIMTKQSFLYNGFEFNYYLN